MSAKIILPVDGDVSSADFAAMFQRMGMSEAVIRATLPALGMAVAGAQAGVGLSQFPGIAAVSMEAAPQVVANHHGGKDTGAVLGG